MMRAANAMLLPIVLCASIAPLLATRPEMNSITAITVERTPCYGTCPVYVATISSDGTVQYKGIRFVKNIGKFTAKVPKAQFQKLAKTIEAIGFSKFDSKYTVPVTDMPTTITSVSRGKEVQRVSVYGESGPASLQKFDKKFDDVLAGIKMWKKDGDIKEE